MSRYVVLFAREPGREARAKGFSESAGGRVLRGARPGVDRRRPPGGRAARRGDAAGGPIRLEPMDPAVRDAALAGSARRLLRRAPGTCRPRRGAAGRPRRSRRRGRPPLGRGAGRGLPASGKRRRRGGGAGPRRRLLARGPPSRRPRPACAGRAAAIRRVRPALPRPPGAGQNRVPNLPDAGRGPAAGRRARSCGPPGSTAISAPPRSRMLAAREDILPSPPGWPPPAPAAYGPGLRAPPLPASL